MDWASRAVDVSFWVSALEQARARFSRPEIFNTDQGSRFTSAAITGMLTAAGIRISMDGRGRWMDNGARDIYLHRLVAHIRRWGAARQWRRGATASAVDSSTRLWR
jgi:hypothetical protein